MPRAGLTRDAHMHLPTGGVGLNIGVQDAMKLGWKRAAVAQGRARDELPGTCHAERRQVGAALLTSTLAQTALIAAFTVEGLAPRQKPAHPPEPENQSRGPGRGIAKDTRRSAPVRFGDRPGRSNVMNTRTRTEQAPCGWPPALTPAGSPTQARRVARAVNGNS